MRPLVQVNIPENFLNPTSKRPPNNSAMRLLTAVVHFKFKKQYLNEGTQTKSAEKVEVKSKALSKLLSSQRYMGGTDQNMAMK